MVSPVLRPAISLGKRGIGGCLNGIAMKKKTEILKLVKDGSCLIEN